MSGRHGGNAETASAECTLAVLVSNRMSSLENVLERIHNQSYERRRIKLVFAENSTDGSLRHLRKFESLHRNEYRGIEILEKVVGISHARNRCLERASGDFILFVDDDVLVPPNALKRIGSFFEANKDHGIVGIRYLPAGSSRVNLIPSVPRWGILPGMGCTGLRTGVVRRLGGFDTSFQWGEDLDYVCRAKDAGYRVDVLGPPNAVHLNTGLDLAPQSGKSKSLFRSALASKRLDARLFLKHKRFFFPVIVRKYGAFVGFAVCLALLPLTWIPAAAAVIGLWLFSQSRYRGAGRLYMPAIFVISGLLSVAGLIRGLFDISRSTDRSPA